MIQTADKEQIGKYLTTLISKKYAHKRTFYKDYLAKQEIDTNDYEIQKISNRLSPILAGEKNIQTYDLIPFSELLEVSIESILTAGKYNKTSDAHITNYSISFSSNKSEWEEYINRPDKLILNYDERGKNIIDYITEAKNYPFLKYLIDKKYISFVDNTEQQDGFSFGGSTIIKRREPNQADLFELKLKYEDELRRKVIVLAMENNDFNMLTQYRARELPFMYMLSRFSNYHITDFYKDMEEEYINAIASSSDKTISYFSEEYCIKDRFGHEETYLYPYLGEVAVILTRKHHKMTIRVLESILAHNLKAFDTLEKSIVIATGELVDPFTSDGKYPIPDKTKQELKKSVLNGFRMDDSRHLISFFFSRSRNDNPGFTTNIFNIPFKSKDPAYNKIINEINQYYEQIIELKI